MIFSKSFLAPVLVTLALCCPGAFASVATIFPKDDMIDILEFGLIHEVADINVVEIVTKADFFDDIDSVFATFFPDESEITYRRMKSAPNTWYGEVENSTGMVNFNLVDGRLSGSATFNSTVYQLFTAPDLGDGNVGLSTRVKRLGVGEFPLDAEPACFNGECIVDTDGVNEMNDPSRNLEEYDTIETMIVYTYRAMCHEAGLDTGCEITDENKAPIEDLARLAVEEANTAYELSGVGGRQKLVHVAMVDETYQEKAGFDEMLNDVTNEDGVIDEVLEWRETYGADLVSMFVANAVSCGLAWLFNGDPGQGFSVVCRDCATGYYSYAHE